MNHPLLSTRYRVALEAAANWHESQTRTDGTPYLGHLLAVSAIVIKAGGSESAAIAALLHDVIEDQDIAPDDIARLFGEYVLALVLAVSEDKSLGKPARKRLYVEQVARSADDVQLISAADKLDNLRDYARNPELCTDDVWEFYRDLLGGSVDSSILGGAYMRVLGNSSARWIYDEMLNLFLGEVPWQFLDRMEVGTPSPISAANFPT